MPLFTSYIRTPGTSRMAGDPWERLSLFESRDIVSQKFFDRHQREINDVKARAVASHIVQSRQYFESARGAGELVRPLLLYYGVLALSRGLVLFLDATRRPSDLSHGHGLSAKDWTRELGEKESAAKGVIDLTVKVQTGTFSELAATTANDEHTSVLSTSHPPEIWGIGDAPSWKVENWIAKGTQFYPDAQTFTLREVLTRLPDLAMLYEDSYKTNANCFRAEVVRIKPDNTSSPVSNESYVIDLSYVRAPLQPFDELADALGIPSEYLMVREDRLPASLSLHLISRDVDVASGNLLPAIRINSKGDNYLMAPIGEVLPSTLSLLFSASYVIGMLVRYHPTTWNLLTSMRAGDRALPLFRAAIALIERRYPFEVLDRLERSWPVDSMVEQPKLDGRT